MRKMHLLFTPLISSGRKTDLVSVLVTRASVLQLPHVFPCVSQNWEMSIFPPLLPFCITNITTSISIPWGPSLFPLTIIYVQT